MTAQATSLGTVRRLPRTLALRLGVPVAAVVLWQLAARAHGSVFFPTPARIVEHGYHLWFSGPAGRAFLTDAAVRDLLPSLGRVLAGFALAAVLGIVLGLALGRSRTVYALCDPVLQFARAVPPPALVPVFVVVFDLGTPMQLASIVFGAIWPVLINTAEGSAASTRCGWTSPPPYGCGPPSGSCCCICPPRFRASSPGCG